MTSFSKLMATVLMIFSFVLASMAQSSGFDVSRMDRTTDACVDFYQFANGSWLRSTKIPAEYPSWNSFTIVYENNQNILKKVVEDAAKTANAPKGSDTQLVGDYYSSCMDEAAIEKAGISPLAPYLAKIAKLETRTDLQRELAELHNLGFGGLFRFYIGPDDKNSSVYLASAYQGGFGLPTRDYWFKDDAKSVETRAKYKEFVTKVFELAGDDAKAAAENMETVTAIQKRFAGAARSPVELRDSEKNYNKRSLADLAKLTPNFSWNNYLKARGVQKAEEVNIGQPEYFQELNKMLVEVPVAQWKTYLRWVVISGSTGSLTKAFRDASFDFYGKYLSGQQEQQARWKTCTQDVDSSIGESLGQEFVKATFSPQAKARMNELIDNLFAAYKERIQKLDWMSEATKKRALEKLAAFSRKIGYPDKLKGYKGLDISRAGFFENSMNAARFEIKRNMAKSGKPVDRTEWGMTPPTVNAYNDSTLNEIVFPAGILQPPFYSANADDALNYGGIGAVIGHEITHGFDDEGSKYDAQGNLKSWWTDADRKAFDARNECVVKQFDGYKTADGTPLNGKLTLGENSADLGGLTMAFLAMENSMKGKPRPANIDGFTLEQRFFLGWAQGWAEVATPQVEATQAQTDPHAIARFRVNGPLSNMPEFAAAFSCKKDNPMVRKDVCMIW